MMTTNPTSSNPPALRDGAEILAALTAAARERILILDGAMGTMIQRLGYTEENFRGDRFKDWEKPLQGNNDLLILTEPKALEDIHYAYAKAGADIVETNTFSGTSIAQADYGMEAIIYELNYEGAQIVRRALDRADGRGRRAPVRGRGAGADQSHGLDFAGREQSWLPGDQLRRVACRL